MEEIQNVTTNDRIRSPEKKREIKVQREIKGKLKVQREKGNKS